MNKELIVSQVYKKADLSLYDFETTQEVKPIEEDIIKQDRAKDSIQFGLSIDKYGYNIYCSGSNSTKKRAYLTGVLKDFAKKKEAPDDICYVYNFEDENKPILIRLPNGEGFLFKDKMNDFVKILKNLKVVFTNSNYEKKKELIMQGYDEYFKNLYDKYKEKLQEYDYSLAKSENALYPAPWKDGKLLSQKEYDKLPAEEKDQYIQKKKQVDLIMIELVSEESNLDKEKESEILKLDKGMIMEVIEEPLNSVKKTFGKLNPKVLSYLDNIQKDVLENINNFKPEEEEQQMPRQLVLLGGDNSGDTNMDFKYCVNLVVDNKNVDHAPVVFAEGEIDENNLFGAIAYNLHGYSVSTDFTQIKSGYILQANGGYLVLKIEDLFKYGYFWEKLKSVLKYRKLEINSTPYREFLVGNTLTPEPIDLNIKIILIGDTHWYYNLFEYDPEFTELFKIHAIFEDEADRNNDTEKDYVRFIARYCKENDLKPFTKNAVASIIEYSSRLADNQNKLVLSYNSIYKILDESDTWATIMKKGTVDKECIEKALYEQNYRVNTYTDIYNKYVKNGTLLINTTDKKVGEINGLAVLDFGDFSSGMPSRITVNTYIGSEGVISVDRNVKLTGKIYDKSVEILQGYLGKVFAQETPLPLCANISFEQNYGGIDGDSATSTMLYAILSELSGVPIKQSIAVTGSMNQKGEVQAIGGVNEKIEGFFYICKELGCLNGEQGVMIPSSNIQNLMLCREVRDAIEKGLFHVYAVDNVREGIEVLTGEKFEDIETKIHEHFKKINDKKNEKKEGEN